MLLQESMVPPMGRRAAAEAIVETELASDEPNGEGSAEIRSALISAQRLGTSTASSNEVVPEPFGKEEDDDRSQWLDNLTPDKSDGGERLVQSADMSETLGETESKLNLAVYGKWISKPSSCSKANGKPNADCIYSSPDSPPLSSLSPPPP